MALLKTMNSSVPRNQWHAELLEQASRPPVSHQHWPTQSQQVEPCRGYDWPDNAI